MASVAPALSRVCIADLSLLNNFVHTGKFYLLNRILERPLQLSPAVLDVEDLPLKSNTSEATVEPSCDFLKPIYMSTLQDYRHYGKRGSYTSSFVACRGELWEQTEPTLEEIKLATRLRNSKIRQEVRQKHPEIQRSIIELGVGEAETVAIAVYRGWALLTDDQASIEVVSVLFSDTPIVQTCCLLQAAVHRRLIPCTEASDLFNTRMVDGLGHRATRKFGDKVERLWLRCSPLRCSWETITSA